jgi:hypothetical protein
MSGGHFDYVQSRIATAADEVAYEIINNNRVDDFGYSNNFNEQILSKLQHTMKNLILAYKQLDTIDRLICGDTNEESFNREWNNIDAEVQSKMFDFEVNLHHEQMTDKEFELLHNTHNKKQ